MKVDQCPKKMKHCPKGQCPEYPCWAVEQHLDNVDREIKNNDSGWE